MPSPDVVLIAGGTEALQGILADDLQHREPPLVGARIDDQALVGERTEHRQDIVGSVSAADGLGGRQRPAADEDGEAAEQSPLGVVEQVVAGVDRGAQRAVSFRRVLRGGGQLEPVAEARQKLAGAENLDAGCCQLDRERQGVERGAEGDDVGHVLRRELEVALGGLRPSDEEGDGRRSARRLFIIRFAREGQRADRKLVLAGQMQDGAARDEQLQLGRRHE